MRRSRFRSPRPRSRSPARRSASRCIGGGRARSLTVLTSLAVAVLAVAIFITPLQVSARVAWAGALGAMYLVDVDGLAAVFLALTGIVFAIGAAASARVPHRRAYFALWCL